MVVLPVWGFSKVRWEPFWRFSMKPCCFKSLIISLLVIGMGDSLLYVYIIIRKNTYVKTLTQKILPKPRREENGRWMRVWVCSLM